MLGFVRSLALIHVGIFVGLVMGAMAQNRLDDRNIDRGVMEHRGKLYGIRELAGAKTQVAVRLHTPL